MLALIRTQNAANNTCNRITQNNRKQRYFQHVESNNRNIDIFIRFDSWPERYPKNGTLSHASSRVTETAILFVCIPFHSNTHWLAICVSYRVRTRARKYAVFEKKFSSSWNIVNSTQKSSAQIRVFINSVCYISRGKFIWNWNCQFVRIWLCKRFYWISQLSQAGWVTAAHAKIW